MKNEKKKEKKRQISTQKWPRKRFLHEILKNITKYQMTNMQSSELKIPSQALVNRFKRTFKVFDVFSKRRNFIQQLIISMKSVV